VVVDALPWLARTSIVFTVVAAALIVVRTTVRHHFGAGVAYAAWAAMPLTLIALSVPAPVRVIADGGKGLWLGRLDDTSPLVGTLQGFLLLVWAAGFTLSVFVVMREQQRFQRGLGPLRLGEHGWVAHGHLSGPAVVGLFPPRLVLPQDFSERYTPDECDLILAHEREHLAGGDPYINGFAVLVRCVFWFHPMVRMAENYFRQDQELACDAAVVQRHPGSERIYAGALLKTQFIDAGLPVGCRWHSHPIEERIIMLKQKKPARARRVVGTVIAAVLASGSAYTAWAAQPSHAAAEESGVSKSTDGADANTARTLDDSAAGNRVPVPQQTPVVPARETFDDAVRGQFTPSYLRDKDEHEGESC
jgi:bla regulator protein BlaR1